MTMSRGKGTRMEVLKMPLIIIDDKYLSNGLQSSVIRGMYVIANEECCDVPSMIVRDGNVYPLDSSPPNSLIRISVSRTKGKSELTCLMVSI